MHGKISSNTSPAMQTAQRPSWQPALPALPHSGLGIASFGASLAGMAAMILAVAIAGIADTISTSGLDEDSAAFIVAGLFFLLGMGSMLTALILGIVALTQAEPPRNKIFALLGTILAGATLVILLFLMISGAILEA